MLSFNSIHFAYGNTPVLQDVSFNAPRGQITCLIGPSGCGKSTLLRLAAGLLPVDMGEIRVDADTVASTTLHTPPEKRSVGLVFQEGALFPHLSVRDNVRFGQHDAESGARAERLLHLTGLEDLVDRFPSQLSGGQRQRVALVRALVPGPRVLLFDEPYANLDPGLRGRLRDVTRALVAELDTVAVFVTHDSEDVTVLADSVVAMYDGRVVQVGTPRELFDTPAHVSVARLFGQAQRVSASKSGDRIETPFGVWTEDCLAVPVPADCQLELLLRPDGLMLEPDDDGLQIAEIRVAGSDDLIGVTGTNNEVLFVRSARPHEFSMTSRVAVRPLAGRAFPESIANATHSQ